MRHIKIFNTSGDVQTALDNGTFGNPYVAKVSGSLDYNTLTPEEPCYLGEWSINGEGYNAFQILDSGSTAWGVNLNIGQLVGVYYDENQINMNAAMSFIADAWHIEFQAEGVSNPPNYDFYEGQPETWEVGEVITEPGQSTGGVWVNWDGVDTFTFGAGTEYPLSMTTINPECPEEGSSD